MHALNGSPLVRRLLRDGYIILAVAFVLLRLFGVQPWDRAIDAFAYWSTRDGSMYDGSLAGTLGAYLYTPAFAQIMAPLVALPWQLFLAIWTAILLAAYGWTVRLAALPLLLFLPIPADIATGNIHLLFAAAIVAGFRYPATWALLALTKVTPFVGVLWFAARREWRSLAIACGVTAAIAGVSIALDPSAWRTWIDILASSSSTPADTPGWVLPVPLLVRLPIAAVVVVVAARTERVWLLPIGVLLALPVVWLNGFAILAALLAAQVRRRDRRPAVARAHAAVRASGGRSRRRFPEARDGRRPVTVAAPAVPARRWDGPLLLLVAGIVLASALVALPVLLKEETRDWIAYEQAATRLDSGQPLYIWQLATEDDEYYLYPPGMAALWAVAGSPELLIAAKVLALLAVGSLAPLVVEDPSKRRLAAVLLAAGAVIGRPTCTTSCSAT